MKMLSGSRASLAQVLGNRLVSKVRGRLVEGFNHEGVDETLAGRRCRAWQGRVAILGPPMFAPRGLVRVIDRRVRTVLPEAVSWDSPA